MRVFCKVFGVPEGRGVYDMCVCGGGGVLIGEALLAPNFALVPSMLRCAQIPWNVSGMFVVIIVEI